MIKKFPLKNPSFSVCIAVLAVTAVLAVSYLEPLFPLADKYPVLRIASPAPQRQATVLSPYGPGFEQELVERFCRETGCTPRWVAAASRDEALAMLEKGEADLVAGFGGDAPPQKPEDKIQLASGRAYAHFRPIRVRLTPDGDEEKAPARAPESAALAESKAEAFSFPAALVPEDAAKNETAQPGQEDDAVTDPASAQAAAQSVPQLFSPAMDLDEDLDQDALLLDPASYALWLPLVGNARTERALSTLIPHRWFWRADSRFAPDLEDYWSGSSLDGFLDLLTERYFGFLPKKPSPLDLLDLADMLTTRLPKYQDAIARAARRYQVPPLLLVAVIYMESRFDPTAVSPTKVRGIMQLTAETARMLGVNRNDPEQCIMGGAKYLRDLWEATEDKALDPWDRWFMALAAFNQGPGSLSGAIRISRQMGGTGTTWAELKTAYPRLTSSRGYEAVGFVERVRYFHYILHGLVALSPAEAQNLAPLLAAARPAPPAGPAS